MFANIVQVVMFKASEPTGVKVYENDDYLSITHAIVFMTMFFTIIRCTKCCFFLFCIKKLAEFICQTENFCKLILGEHSDKGL